MPDLGAITALVDATSAAGTPTTLRADGYPTSLPPPVALAAYRIVQESLTNVIRHAGRASATVTLRHQRGQLLVDVVNDGVTGHAPFSDGTGAGLTGMRERAAVLGGTLRPDRVPAAASACTRNSRPRRLPPARSRGAPRPDLTPRGGPVSPTPSA